jgi:RNA polymerase sigma factor (sigma-70 family)
MNVHQELETLHRASFGWALACCRDGRQEAEDVLHAAYVKVLEGRAKFDGRSSFRTWLFGVIRRTALESRRRRWLRGLLLEDSRDVDAGEPATPGADELAELSEENRRLALAIQHLSERQRQVLHLVYYQDLTVEEAAQMLGISPGSARTHFARGKERLRTLLQSPEAP